MYADAIFANLRALDMSVIRPTQASDLAEIDMHDLGVPNMIQTTFTCRVICHYLTWLAKAQGQLVRLWQDKRLSQVWNKYFSTSLPTFKSPINALKATADMADGMERLAE